MAHPDGHSFPPRILVVDDENSTRMVIGRALQLLGYGVDEAGDGEEALKHLATTRYDVMLLDLNMPNLNGSQVMDVVRDLYPETQIIVLTAYATLDSAIAAVKTGAADYLLKPQSIVQIEESVKRALKRRLGRNQREYLIDIIGDALHTLQSEEELTQHPPIPDPLSGPVELNGLLFDPEQRKVVIYADPTMPDQAAVHTAELTSHQCAILSYMVYHPHKVLSNMEISREALGYQGLTEIEADRIIRPHILKLRRKIEVDPASPRLIRSVRGKGYLFSPP